MSVWPLAGVFRLASDRRLLIQEKKRERERDARGHDALDVLMDFFKESIRKSSPSGCWLVSRVSDWLLSKDLPPTVNARALRHFENPDDVE